MKSLRLCLQPYLVSEFKMTSTATKATAPDQIPTAEILFTEPFVVKLMKGGKVEARWTLHKGVAAFSSDYFEAAMKNTFKEGQNSCIEIADIDKTAFSQLVAWMYTRKFEDYGGRQSYDALVSLYILADLFMVRFLGNILIDRMHAKSIAQNFYSPFIVTRSYNETPEKSPLRRFAIDLWVTCSHANLAERTRQNDWGSEILCDIMQAMFEDRENIAKGVNSKERQLKMDLCKYHTHKEGERCPPTK